MKKVLPGDLIILNDYDSMYYYIVIEILDKVDQITVFSLKYLRLEIYRLSYVKLCCEIFR